jgi:thioredoxin 1
MNLTRNNFEDMVLKSDKPVLIDFWASWCGPCRMQGPIFEDAEKEAQGKANFFKVNVDEENELAEMFQVMSIPTIVAFKDGKIINKRVGVTNKQVLLKMISG